MKIPEKGQRPHFQANDNTLGHIATFPGFGFEKEEFICFVINFFIFRYFSILGETFFFGAILILGNLTARFTFKNC